MTVKSLNHKELTKMSSESMKKKRASDARTVHFARFGRIRRRREREVINSCGEGKWAEFTDADWSEKGKMRAWGAGPSLRSRQWVTAERTHH